MKNLFNKLDGKVALLAATGLGMASAHAAVDTADVITAVTAAVASVGIVGTAVLGVKVAVKAFAWVRAAIS